MIGPGGAARRRRRRRAAPQRHRRLRPGRGGRADRGLEDVRKEVMAAAGVPTAATLAVARGAVRRQGRRPRRGQGRLRLPHRRGARRRPRGRRARSASTVVVEELLEGAEVSLFALCDGRTRRAARRGAGLQAGRRRRHGPEHRRHGRLSRRSAASTTPTSSSSRSTSRCSTSSRGAARRSSAASSPG